MKRSASEQRLDIDLRYICVDLNVSLIQYIPPM